MYNIKTQFKDYLQEIVDRYDDSNGEAEGQVISNFNIILHKKNYTIPNLFSFLCNDLLENKHTLNPNWRRAEVLFANGENTPLLLLKPMEWNPKTEKWEVID